MRRNGTSSVLGAFLGGAVVGGIAALLFSPKSGEEMRELMREFIDDEMDTAKDKFGEAEEFVREKIEKFTKKPVKRGRKSAKTKARKSVETTVAKVESGEEKPAVRKPRAKKSTTKKSVKKAEKI